VIGYAGVAGANLNAHINASTSGASFNYTGYAGDHQHWFEVPNHTHAFTTAAAGGVETRPVNVAVIYAIRTR